MLLWYFHVLHPSILNGRIPTKGNEFTFEVGITLSSCFHKDLAAVARDIQQRGDSFTQISWSGSTK
jgi:hypothetical protein